MFQKMLGYLWTGVKDGATTGLQTMGNPGASMTAGAVKYATGTPSTSNSQWKLWILDIVVFAAGAFLLILAVRSGASSESSSTEIDVGSVSRAAKSAGKKAAAESTAETAAEVAAA